MANRNTLWAEVFVDELARAGLQAVCLAPGSRHTPLVMAFARHPDLRVYSHLDERSAAFFALGLALGSDTPVAVVCTSGTATANFLPAVIEAHQSEVPLLVLTADRPHELRDSGANQTIDQVGMFANFALWSVDVALPEAAPPDVALRNLRTLAARAFATANGLRKGVVHLNFPFRKPLEPTPVPTDQTAPGPQARPRPNGAPFTRVSRPVALADDATLEGLLPLLSEHTRGLIVCGPRCPAGEFPAQVAALAERAGYPLLADPLSGVRFGFPAHIGAYDTFLSDDAARELVPEVVIRFGQVPTSAALNRFLDQTAPAQVIHVRPSGVWADDTHRVSHFVQADEAQFCQALCDRLPDRQTTTWQARWQALEATARSVIMAQLGNGPAFDGAFVADVVSTLPDGGLLFAGNSLPVRHLDQFGLPAEQHIRAYANRGASGIDGNTSTALGLGAAHPDQPLVLVTGDITFYHDMNGLLAVHRCGIPLIVVLLNNNGGGIFHRLPINQFDPEFTQYFITAHDLDFSHAARLYGLEYVRPENREAFRQTLADRLARRTSTLIEVQTDARQDTDHRQRLMQAVLTACYHR
ncbi:MAG: 2-succinyl-5-enolpyruvyl-6-hydroxy-3-cyclohexene-1-carboxylic-acid synthase [Anaerolineae bacterium]